MIGEKVILTQTSPCLHLSSVHVTQSCLTLCDPMDCSKPDLPVHHHSQSLLKLMSIELVMPSNHLILCYPLLLPSIFPSFRVFSDEAVLSASASVPPVNIQGWFPLYLPGLISLQSSGLSRVFNTTVWKHRSFGTQPSLWSNSHIHSGLRGKT